MLSIFLNLTHLRSLASLFQKLAVAVAAKPLTAKQEEEDENKYFNSLLKKPDENPAWKCVCGHLHSIIMLV